MFQNEGGELNLVPKECFGAILGAAMLDARIESYNEFYQMLLDAGINNIDSRRISEYCKGMYTPPFLKAKQMLSILNYTISDEELEKALNASKQYAKERQAQKSYRRKNDQEIRISVRLKLSRMMPQQPPDRASLILDERIEHLCGNKRNYTDYLQALIAKDLDEYILNRDAILAIRKENNNG